MSPRNASRSLIRGFSLAGAPSLPVTGDLHPLRKEFTRWMTVSNGLTLLIGVLILATYLTMKHMKRGEDTSADTVPMVRLVEMGVPPSITEATAPQVNVAPNVAPPSIGVPEPVPELQAQQTTIATQAEMADVLAPITMNDLAGGDSLVVNTDFDYSPGSDEFVSVEEQPVRLRIDPPLYPELARQAGIEATVMIRALVGKDGRVKKCIVAKGQQMLNQAAIDCAQTAVFTPALQRKQPVEVWVMMPIIFEIK